MSQEGIVIWYNLYFLIQSFVCFCLFSIKFSESQGKLFVPSTPRGTFGKMSETFLVITFEGPLPVSSR